jgi:hypothetical protein
MKETFFVSLNMNEALALIDDAILAGSLTGELIDSYGIESPQGACVVNVYEKHFMRAGNRLTLTVVVDSFTGSTRVHCVGGGGGEGLFRFDWGASDSFAGAAARALQQYRI